MNHKNVVLFYLKNGSTRGQNSEISLFERYILAVGQWISPGTLFSSTIKTDHHDIAEILLKVTLTTRTPKPTLLGVILSIYVKINIMIFLKI